MSLNFDLTELLFVGVNKTTEATAKTTAYDRLFSCFKAIQALLVKEKLGDDVSKVTANMLADAYKKVSSCFFPHSLPCFDVVL